MNLNGKYAERPPGAKPDLHYWDRLPLELKEALSQSAFSWSARHALDMYMELMGKLGYPHDVAVEVVTKVIHAWDAKEIKDEPTGAPEIEPLYSKWSQT